MPSTTPRVAAPDAGITGTALAARPTGRRAYAETHFPQNARPRIRRRRSPSRC